MTVSLNTAAPAKAASDAAPTAADKSPKFAKMIDSVDVNVAVADGRTAAASPNQTPPANETLEALLQTLKVTLFPSAALLPVTSKKPGDPDKIAGAKDKPAKDGEEDDASTCLAALILPQAQLASVAKDAGKQVGQPIDDMLSKPATRGSLLADAPAVATPTLLVDFTALADASSVKTLDQPSPLNATIDRLVDTARDAAWLDRLSRDITESAGTGDRVRFRMLPPSLGALDVSVERQAAGLSVSMTTHTPEARNLIADSRQQMVDGLKAQGVPVIQLSLATAGEEQAGHRPPTFFNPLIEVAAPAGTELAAHPVETTAERMGRFA